MDKLLKEDLSFENTLRECAGDSFGLLLRSSWLLNFEEFSLKYSS